MNPDQFSRLKIAVVIPAFRVERHILNVLQAIPAYIQNIIVVNDCSPDATASLVEQAAQKDTRILLINHKSNLGVGGAMQTGFIEAARLGAQIVVKMDGDGQMSPQHLPDLLAPLALGRADYTKGNRFRDFTSLQHMPFMRRIGNLGLSFLSKAATGYWSVFDPTNGYFAIRAELINRLPFDQIDKRYFFETSMLANLYLLGAVVRDVPIPARYGDEESSLSVTRSLFEFPPKLLRAILRRILLKHFVFDFSILSIYLIAGLPLIIFGLGFGINRWIYYASQGIPAPTGTIMLPTLSLLLGIQLLLSAIQIDLVAEPKSPLTTPLLQAFYQPE